MGPIKDYNAIVRASIRRDFASANYKRNAREPKTARENARRVVWLNPDSQYFKFRKLILGKLVRIVGNPSTCGVWVEFIKDSDREALNNAAGWSDKKMYLLDGAKFDD